MNAAQRRRFRRVADLEARNLEVWAAMPEGPEKEAFFHATRHTKNVRRSRPAYFGASWEAVQRRFNGGVR